MIVTTARKQATRLESQAISVAHSLHAIFVKREDVSVEDLLKAYESQVLVVGQSRLTLYSRETSEPFFYHPSSAMFRVKQFLRTGDDRLIQVTQLSEGMSFLDCTLGLASDSLVAKLAVGSIGKVIGLEANQEIAFIVANGLSHWQEGPVEMIERMREIEVIHAQHRSYLEKAETSSIDVVYFDPMFEQHVERSTGIRGLKAIACHDDLNKETIQQAIRVAKKRVVLKDHWQSERFSRYGFTQIKRSHAAFHYGFIDVTSE
ncbi:class I SAM-dependent methyltransferase [Bacillus sp. FJAT-45037]|uniref:class I SAM-dependent methyltransferase n=1 Tax=Bacillus sp. FJAT-45037 TaxID=2011007 RepID=UPI000C232698|nr:class I SAM-dependent methyltransferase [Bacillus sp. FJAT-45037]